MLAGQAQEWQAEPNLAAIEAWPRQPLGGPCARRCRAGRCRVHSKRKRQLRAVAAGWHVKLGAGGAEGPLQQGRRLRVTPHPQIQQRQVKWVSHR